MRILIFTFLLVTAMNAMQTARADDPAEIPLWKMRAAAQGTAPKDTPSITPYLPDPAKATGLAIVICPGGGYAHLAPHEGKDYALFLNQHGIAGFVLKYRLGSDGYHYPYITQDGIRAMRFVRANAAQWSIDPHRLGIMGSSAGGHLASTVMTHFDAGDASAADPIDRESCRPDFGILCYAVISFGDIAHVGSRQNLLGDHPSDDLIKLLSNELQVTPQTPPCFIWAGG